MLRVDPDADGAFIVFDGDKFSVSLCGQGVEGGDEVEFVLSGGEEGVHNLHGNLDFDLALLFGGFLGSSATFVANVTKEMVGLLVDADIAVAVLNGYYFPV